MANRERLTQEHKILRALRLLTRDSEPEADPSPANVEREQPALAAESEYHSAEYSRVRLELLGQDLPGVRQFLQSCVHVGIGARARAK